MKNKLFASTAFIGCLSLIILLTSTAFVQAVNIDKWTASGSLKIKATTSVKDNSGNHKLVTTSETFDGTLNLYTETNGGVTPGPDGCIAEFLSSDGTTTVCFDELEVTNSLNAKTGKASIIFVGTGNIETTVQGQKIKGIGFITGKGSGAVDKGGNVISLSLGATIGGGFTPGDNPSVIVNGSIATTALSK